MQPLVSIVIPTYNRKAMLMEAIDSAMSQRYRNIEIIVIDDGSTDGTEQIMLEKCQENTSIQYVRQENSGVSAARNHGARMAKGEYLSFLDSDDIYLPSCIQDKIQMALINNDWEVIGGGCDYLTIGATNLMPSTPARPSTTYADLCIYTAFPGASNNIFVKRNSFLRVGGFNENLKNSEDRDLLRRLAAMGKIISVPHSTVTMRIHSEERSGRHLERMISDRQLISKQISEPELRKKSLSWNAFVAGNAAWNQKRCLLAIRYWILSVILCPAKVHPDLPRLKPIVRRILGRE
jgi:glycosyltransferase involved in cell wall biosynthesis